MLLEYIAEMLTLVSGLIVAYFVYVLISKKDDDPSSDSPSMAHTALREIVEQAVEDAKKLPNLSGSSSEPPKSEEAKDVAEHSYEDLLATAILNKVIEKFQKEQVDGNSNVLHGKPVSAGRRALSECELTDEGCSSSLEPLSREDCTSDCSASCSRRVRNQPEPLSLTIEERIEEVTTTYTSDEDPRDNDVLAVRNAHRVPFPELGMDIIDPSQESSEDSQDERETPRAHIGLVSPIESWEENWLFQKKRVPTQADPVAMLVPNPSADFKALIGDKDAEDTSDLSECSSAQSDEEIEKELMEAINNVVPRCPKEAPLGNDLDSCSKASSDFSLKENHVEVFSNDVCLVEIGDSKEADSRGLLEETNIEKEEGKKRKVSEKILLKIEKDFEEWIEADEDDEAKEAEDSTVDDFEKETEGNSEKVDARREKPVRESASRPRNDSKRIESERQAADGKPKEASAGNVDDSRNAYRSREPAGVVENSSSFNSLLESTTVSLSEENASNVPKTPASTPTRTSVIDVSLASENYAEMTTWTEQRVLSSLECAKKRLLAVEEDIMEASKEEIKSVHHGTDFHAEDIQQESEYTEHYDTAIQRHLDSLTKTDACVLENGTVDEEDKKESKCREAVAFAKAESASQSSLLNRKPEEEVQLATPPRPGTIAEREHKKWENAPPIENNPYSEENIQKRLWERQYSRRSSDIPGIHTELPKSNGADLEVVLIPQEPDIKRFGRDYYINDSRASSNEKGRRSAASTCSRPSSSLSQRSSSTNADQEQQVSFELDKFEAASLRSSISRWSYRDPCSSPHFAINPLLRMDLDDNELSRPNEKTNDRVGNLDVSNERLFSVESGSIVESTNLLTDTAESGSTIQEIANRNSETECSSQNISDKASDESLPANDITNTVAKDLNGTIPERQNSFDPNDPADNVAYNPLYEPEQSVHSSSSKFNANSDSGIYSPSLDHVEENKRQDHDPYRRLWINDWDNDDRESQILSSNGRRYWSFNGYKYYTFGGIKSSDNKSVEDSDEDNSKAETPDESLSFDISDFGKLKFQTFGGIKRSKKIDGKGIPAYRRVKLRSSLRPGRNRNARSYQNDSVAENSNRVVDGGNFQTKNTLYENFDLRSPDWRYDPSETKNFQSFRTGQNLNSFYLDGNEEYREARTIFSASYESSSDDDWQDEDIHVPNKLIMRKFLKDASKRTGTKPRSEDSVYFLNTSRRKVFDDGPKRVRSQTKHRLSDENESLKLEPPIVPEVVERTFETLRDLRVKGRRKKRKSCEQSSGKKLGVRSLSDVTIW